MADDLYATPEHAAFRELVRRFVESELRPRAREFDRMGRIDKTLYKRMGELGLLGLRYDERWGGAGLDWSYTAVLFEELARSDNAGVTLGISVQTDMATPSLHRFGSDALREKYLTPAIAGEMVAGIAVTEPAAGSDVAGIKTRAVRDGDDWVINGSKLYITNAATADWLCLLAVTDRGAGHAGFSQIVVPTDVPGFRYELLDKIGNWGSDTGQLFLEDVRVPLSHTIGEIGRGFQQQMMQFQDERLVACVNSVAASFELWEQTKRWCQERVLFGKPLAKMQVTQFKLVELLTQLTAARELTHSCIRKRIADEDATLEISLAKLFCGRAVRTVADECIQLHGGYGYMKESAAGRAFVDSRLMSIGAGAHETMITAGSPRSGACVPPRRRARRVGHDRRARLHRPPHALRRADLLGSLLLDGRLARRDVPGRVQLRVRIRADAPGGCPRPHVRAACGAHPPRFRSEWRRRTAPQRSS